MPSHNDYYLARFQPVLRHIEQQLDQPLPLAELAELAAFSPFHFHRQFSALFGLTVHQYVQLLRLKRASYQLAFRSEQSVTAIGFACGYQNSESFSRAFRQLNGQSPSHFRQAPDWLPWHSRYEPLARMNSQRTPQMPFTDTQTHSQKANPQRADAVTLRDFPATRVAVLEHRGDPRLLGDSIRRFIAWRKANRLPPALSATFNLLYDNPADTEPDAFRLDLCAAITAPITCNAAGIIEKHIPAGRCAVLRHYGSDDSLAQSVSYLYGEWLPDSGETLRDFPLFLQRVAFFPDVPEQDAIVDIFLPLR